MTALRAFDTHCHLGLDDRGDALLFVGRSSTHVRQEYADSFQEYLDEEEREQVTGLTAVPPSPNNTSTPSSPYSTAAQS